MLRKLESSREEAFSKGFELISVPLIFGHPKSWTFSVPLIFGHPQPKIKGSRKFKGIRYASDIVICLISETGFTCVVWPASSGGG